MKELLKTAIYKVNAEAIRPLRHSELRKGQDFSTTSYLRDHDHETFHMACFKEEKIVVCATFYPEHTEKSQAENAYRLRGMATEEGKRRKGYGKEIIKKIEKILIKKKQNYIWCKARLEALEFYKKLGFLVIGEKFNIKDIGPHYIMYKKL